MFCNSCGAAVDEGVHFCTTCGSAISPAATAQPVLVGSETEANAARATRARFETSPQAASFKAAPAFAPPLSASEPRNAGQPAAAPIGGSGLAGLGERLGASILDMIVVVIIFAMAGMATATHLGGVTDSGFSLNGAPAALAIFITLVVGFLYYWLAEGLFGSTLGKAICGLEVRRKTGERCGMRASLLRNLLRIVDGIGVYLVGFFIVLLSKTRQRLGDYVAGTLVVQSSIAKPVRILAMALWVLVVTGGLTAAIVIHHGAPETVTGEFIALPAAIPATSTGRLKAGNVAFTEIKNGPVRPSAVFKPGDLVFLKYDIAGFARDATQAPHLNIQLTATDPAGLLIHEPWEIHFNGPVGLGKAVNGTLGLQLPPYSPPGNYKIAVKVHDEVANTNLEFTPSLDVNAPTVAPAHGLELRDLQLSRSENGPAESMLAVEGGGTVYMSSNVFGLQFRDGHTKASMSLKILGPDGEVALDQPDFVDLSETQFYRPPTYWVHVHGSLPIQSGVKAGVYTAQYGVRDDISNQRVMQEVKFDVQ